MHLLFYIKSKLLATFCGVSWSFTCLHYFKNFFVHWLNVALDRVFGPPNFFGIAFLMLQQYHVLAIKV